MIKDIEKIGRRSGYETAYPYDCKKPFLLPLNSEDFVNIPQHELTYTYGLNFVNFK
jgi:hypothetical protein